MGVGGRVGRVGGGGGGGGGGRGRGDFHVIILRELEQLTWNKTVVRKCPGKRVVVRSQPNS